jgi:hypothetical protein
LNPKTASPLCLAGFFVSNYVKLVITAGIFSEDRRNSATITYFEENTSGVQVN